MGTIVNLLWQIFMLMGILYCEWPKFKTYSTHLVTLAENTHLLQKGKFHCAAELLFEWFVFN